jgi:hypothetical protein
LTHEPRRTPFEVSYAFVPRYLLFGTPSLLIGNDADTEGHV